MPSLILKALLCRAKALLHPKWQSHRARVDKSQKDQNQRWRTRVSAPPFDDLAAAQYVVFVFGAVVLQREGLWGLGNHLVQREFFVEHAGKLKLRRGLRAPF